MKRILILFSMIFLSSYCIAELVQFENKVKDNTDNKFGKDNLEEFIDQIQVEEKEGLYFPIAKKRVKKLTQVFSSPNSKLPFSILKKNTEVLIYDRKNKWERITIEGEKPQWVNSSDLCDLDECDNIREPYKAAVNAPLNKLYVSQSKKVNQSNQRKQISSINTSNTKTRVIDNYDYSCACSKTNFCVGPRGGHYCITSGGNKRYLPR